jgi:hypothetical protein
MIPRLAVVLMTFPGVIVHEFAHALFCKLFGIEIYEIRYFKFDPTRPVNSRAQGPIGYVISAPARNAWQSLMICLGPFIVNTVVGGLIAIPAAIPVFQFGQGDALDFFLCWLGISIAMHAFPSPGDADTLWRAIKSPKAPLAAKIVGLPIMGLIYLGVVGSVAWLDLLYGIAVVGFIPRILVNFLADFPR